jgi:2-desacetyl-2-hydroxyethyl bacteriochlorophyllide A dehydrogenase
MKAIQIKAPHQLAHVDIPSPACPGPGEALVATHCVGICGTDISSYLGKFPFFDYPRIPGHELGVEVLEVGPDVTNVRPGDRCSVEPYMNNPRSFASQKGLSNCCQDLQVIGVHTDGGMCERFLIRADKLHVSPSLGHDQLALVETLAIGCHAIERAAPRAGENLLIIGAGSIGLATLEFALVAGAKVTIMDMSAARLEFCQQKYRVEHTVLSKGDGSELESLQQITAGELYPIVIDATGNAAAMSYSLNYVSHGGTLVFVGITTQEIKFPHRVMHARELTLKSSRNALPDDFRRIIRLIEEGRIDTQPWITHRTSFDNVVNEFDSFTKPETGVIKALVSLP